MKPAAPGLHRDADAVARLEAAARRFADRRRFLDVCRLAYAALLKHGERDLAEQLATVARLALDGERRAS